MHLSKSFAILTANQITTEMNNPNYTYDQYLQDSGILFDEHLRSECDHILFLNDVLFLSNDLPENLEPFAYQNDENGWEIDESKLWEYFEK